MRIYYDKVNEQKVFDQGWPLYASISVPPVLLITYICCHYERSELLLGLFLMEWIAILMAWRFLCPWLGRRSVALAAVPFILSFLISGILTRENLGAQGAVWSGSDDLWYLQEAERVREVLILSNWNLLKAWSEITSVWEGSAWTLAGWPYVLGLVGSFIGTDVPPIMLHAIALSLNATFLSLVLALIFNVLRLQGQRFPMLVLTCFLLLAGDPIVYAGECLKESMLQLSLMLAFLVCVKLAERIQTSWIILGCVGFLGILTSRPTFIPILLFSMYRSVIGRFHLVSTIKLALTLILCAITIALILDFRIREIPLVELLKGKSLLAEAGIAMTIYKIPLIGPILFYAISPAPVLPWNIINSEHIIKISIRSLGSIAWFLSACFVMFSIFKRRYLMQDNIFMAALIMFLGFFIAVVLAGDDPRYKQPTNFYLAIMLCLTFYDGLVYRQASFNPSKRVV